MNYLSQQAALIAAEKIGEAISRLERNIEECGTLTHKDAKQSDAAKAYFANAIDHNKADVECLKRLRADLAKQSWRAFCAEKTGDGPLP